MSQQCAHIRRLYRERGIKDPNSTTLANTLDKDIQTVFNSPDKFVMELLQNADDATDQDQNIDVTFQLTEGYLMFSHTGKHFNRHDVDAICDNAQQHYTEKIANLNRTGYKGVGFKSVFVISECVYILSNKYCFRFDRQQWNDSITSTNRYPWQIIPIWTDYWELPRVFDFNNSHVNFIFRIKNDTIPTVRQAIRSLLKNPYTILFQRHVRRITINMDNQVQCIKLRKSYDQNDEVLLYINEQVNSRWLIIPKQQDICHHIHDQLQGLKDHECPPKLKNATCINIQFAIQFNSNHQVKPMSNGNLFCYLPTQVDCNLPFLVNADFLLSADRMQLLSNIWNEYLFQCIAQFHIESLQIMAQMELYRDDILTLFTPELTSATHTPFINAYHQTIATALDDIAFIPSYLDPSRLLKWREAIGDNLQFFIRFPSIDPSYQKYIASYTLRHGHKLYKNFTQSTLADRIHKYAIQSLHQDCYERLLEFLISAYPPTEQFYRRWKCSLANKKFLLTIQNQLVSSAGTFLPLHHDSKLRQFLSFLNAHFIHPDLLNISGLKPWLESMGICNIADDVLVRFIEEWIVSQGANLIHIDPMNSVVIVQLLSDIRDLFISKGSVLKTLPLITKSKRLIPAKECYLPSVLHPTVDLEKIIGNQVDIVDDNIYGPFIADNNKLRSTLINLKVKEDIAFFCGEFHRRSDSSDIDSFDEYYNTCIKDKFGSHGIYRYHIAYLPYMRYLKVASYAKLFFKCLHLREADIVAGMTDFKPFSQSNRNTYNHKNVDHYLKFMLNGRRPCILGQDNQLYRMKDLYITSITDKLDDKLKHLIPQMKFRFDDVTIKLSDQLMALLGAQQELSYQDTIKLLNAITDDDADRYHQIFQGLYELILKASWSTNSQADDIRHHRVQLLASDKSRQSAALLYSFCCRYIRIQPHPNLFHSFPDITKKDELALCRCLGIQVVDSNDYDIFYKQTTQDICTDHIKHMLKMIVITVSSLNLIKDKKKLLHQWITQLEQLQVLKVEGLIVKVKLPPHTTFEVEAIISARCLYFRKELPLAGYIEAIGQYLQLPPKQVDILQHIYNMKSDLECKQLLEYYRYDVSALAKLDEMDLLPDDIKKEDDSDLIVTRKTTFDHRLTSNDDRRLNPKLYDPTLEAEAPGSYTRRTGNISIPESQGDQERENWRLEPAAKKCRLSKIDYQNRFDDYVDDLSHVTRHDRLPYSNRQTILSWNDDLLAEAVKLKTLEGHSDPSSDAFSNVQLGKVLPDVGHFDFNDFAIPSQTNSVVSAEPRHIRRHLPDNANHQWTGRWGEHFTYRYFIKYYERKLKSIRKTTPIHGTTEMVGIDKKGRKRSITLTWLNDHQENNQPFDIKLVKNGRRIYIEVKTTYKSKDLFVKISHKEWTWMCQHRSDYRLCCVYNAGAQGDTAPILKQIKDPASKFFNGTLTPREIHFKL